MLLQLLPPPSFFLQPSWLR